MAEWRRYSLISASQVTVWILPSNSITLLRVWIGWFIIDDPIVGSVFVRTGDVGVGARVSQAERASYHMS